MKFKILIILLFFNIAFALDKSEIANFCDSLLAGRKGAIIVAMPYFAQIVCAVGDNDILSVNIHRVRFSKSFHLLLRFAKISTPKKLLNAHTSITHRAARHCTAPGNQDTELSIWSEHFRYLAVSISIT